MKTENNDKTQNSNRGCDSSTVEDLVAGTVPNRIPAKQETLLSVAQVETEIDIHTLKT